MQIIGENAQNEAQKLVTIVTNNDSALLNAGIENASVSVATNDIKSSPKSQSNNSGLIGGLVGGK